ncbi:MAG: hypothetical protein ABJB33_02010, partial [Gemmatimonadota bacterium]
ATVATRAAVRTARPPDRLTALLPWGIAALAIIAALWGWAARPKPPGTSQQYIRLGDGTNVGEEIAFLNLSPDGSTIVFRDNSQNGRLWLKRRGALTPVVVPGTERANYPTFSPDGQWIAFIADGRLKKIRLDGGAAVTLADSALGGFGGVAWMGDGTLTFVGPQFGVISRVSVSGGAPAHVLDDTAVAGFGFGGLAPLPKGRGLLFTVCNSGCVTMAVHVLDLRTRAHHLVLDNVSKASYLPSGELLYIRRDGAALVAPFDLSTLEISGAAVPVLEDVNVSSFLLANLAWSLNGTLVYVQGTGASNETELVRVDRRGNATLVDSSWHGDFNSFALAPDGRRVAVGVGSVSGALSIWLRSLAPGPFTRLTFGGGDRRPAWSSDGRIVAYVHDTLNASVVFARRVDGSGPEHLLARLDRQVQEVTWSPRGDWLVLRTDNGSAGAGDLVGIRTNGDTTPVSLVNSSYSEMHPAVSPDERWIAYVSNESGLNEVYVRPFPATNTARWQVSSGGGEGPRWSPDGRELYFAANNSVMAASLRVTPTFEVTAVHRLFDLPVAVYAWDTFHPSWNVLPNGQGFLMLRNRRSIEVQQVSRVVYMENWFADVRARMAH